MHPTTTRTIRRALRLRTRKGTVRGETGAQFYSFVVLQHTHSVHILESLAGTCSLLVLKPFPLDGLSAVLKHLDRCEYGGP